MLYQTHRRRPPGSYPGQPAGHPRPDRPGRKLLIAVKANAYGHGAVAVRAWPRPAGVDWLGVATVPEGLQLRQAGIGLPILKLSPAFPEEMEPPWTAGLTLAVCDQANALALEAVCAARGVPGRRAPGHRHRHGPDRRPASGGARPWPSSWPERCPHLHVQGAFTHLPVSDAADPTYTEAQIQRFRAAVAAVEARLGASWNWCTAPIPARSWAIRRAGWTWSGPAIMIYGFYPDPGTPRTIPLLPGPVLPHPGLLPEEGGRGHPGRLRPHLGRPGGHLDRHPAGGLRRRFQPPVLQPRPGADRRPLLPGGWAGLHGPGHGRPGPGDDGAGGRRGGAHRAQRRPGDHRGRMGRMLGTITYEVTCQINARVERIYIP